MGIIHQHFFRQNLQKGTELLEDEGLRRTTPDETKRDILDAILTTKT